MSSDLQSMDITGSPELLRLAEEVHRSGVSRLLKRGDQDLAMLTPVGPRRNGIRRPRRGSEGEREHDAILNIIGIGESTTPTDIALEEREYLAEAYAPKPR